MARNVPARQQQAAPAPADDAWETSTGMPDKFEGYMSESFFGVDEKYNAEAMLFCSTLLDGDGEPITTLKYSVGQDWEASDDGTELTHPTKTKINNSSRYGRFIDRIVRPVNEKAPKRADVISPDGKENGLGLLELLKSRGTPLQAASFDGLGFFWEQHQMETLGTDENKKPIIKNVLLPTAYIGTWEDREANGAKASRGATAAATRPASTGPKRAAPAAPAGDSGAAEPEIPAKLRVRLTPMASSSDAKGFLRAASRDAEVAQLPEDAMNYVLSGGPNGFWASVQD